MSVTAVRSAGGAFMQSGGGVRQAKFYYDPTPYIITLNFSQFTLWNNSPTAANIYDVNQTLSSGLPLYTLSNVYIGEITQTIICTPRLHIYDPFSLSGNYKPTAPILCPEGTDVNYVVEDDTHLAMQYMEAVPFDAGVIPEYWYDTNYASQQGRLLSAISPTQVPPPAATDGSLSYYYNGFYARSSLAALTTTFYEHPISGVALIRIGNVFRPHIIKVVIDVNINTWYTGKFTNSIIRSSGTDASYYITPDRATKTFTESTGDGTVYYTYYDTGSTVKAWTIANLTYYSCARYNTRITMPT